MPRLNRNHLTSKIMENESSRRSFIKTTTLGAAGIALASSAKSYGQVSGANKKVRVAVAGLKRRGKPIIESLSKIDGVEVTYVLEVDSRQMKKGLANAEEVLGYKPKAEVDLRKVVEKKDVDAVFLTTPDHWHAYGTMISVNNGKHVYVEKPCGYNLDEDQMMVQMGVKHPDLKIQMGNQQRSSPESREIIGEIHKGVIGDVYKAVAFYNNNRGPVNNPKVVPVPDFLDWEVWQGPAPRHKFLDILEDYDWHWLWPWGTAESGNNGTHELDIARWAIQGDYPESVQSHSGKFHFVDDGWEMYDTMEATFRFPGNKVVQWDGKSRNGYHTYGSGRGTIVYGTEGSVFVNRSGYTLYDRGGKVVRERKGGQEGGLALGGGGDMTTLHVRNFIDAIRNGDALNSHIEEGAKSTHLAHYANVSSMAQDSYLKIDPTNGKFRDWKAMKAFWSRDYEPGWEVKV